MHLGPKVVGLWPAIKKRLGPTSKRFGPKRLAQAAGLAHLVRRILLRARRARYEQLGQRQHVLWGAVPVRPLAPPQYKRVLEYLSRYGIH